MVKIKDINVLVQLLSEQYFDNLIKILIDVHSLVDEIVITEGWRKGGGVHSTKPCRGLDLRSWIYTSEKLIEIEKYINKRWIYDPARPDMVCCIVHDVGKGNHIHLQIHPKTKRA